MEVLSAAEGDFQKTHALREYNVLEVTFDTVCFVCFRIMGQQNRPIPDFWVFLSRDVK